MLFCRKRSFSAITPSTFHPLYITFIRTHLAYTIQATHPILSRDAKALEKVQKLVLKFVKGLRHVPYEAALQQLRLFFLTHHCGDLISMFKITHGLLEFPMASYPHPTSSTSRDVVRTFTIWVVPFWNKLPAEIVTPGCQLAVLVIRSTHLTHLLPQPIPSAHIDPRKKLPNDPSHIPPHHPTWSIIVVFTAS